MDACPRLKVIAKHGAGVDNIDIPAATARGIVVASVPGGNADAVAEATVAMMLAALRRVPEVHGLVAGGRYSVRWELQFEQLLDRTLGLLGIGNIGARVARICAAGFRMRVLAYDPALPEAAVRDAGRGEGRGPARAARGVGRGFAAPAADGGDASHHRPRGIAGDEADVRFWSMPRAGR